MGSLDLNRPSPEEELQHAERFREAEAAARAEKQAFYCDPSPLRDAYFADPAHGGKPVAILDWIAENSPAQRAHPGLGGPWSGGFLPSIHELSNTFSQVLAEELDRRLGNIPPEERGKHFVLLLFGQPGSGKTTLAYAAVRLPQVAGVIERVGGDGPGLMRIGDRYRRMGFQVRLIAPMVTLGLSMARSVHRAFWNARPVSPQLVNSFYQETLEALPKIHSDRHYQCMHLPGGAPPENAPDETAAFETAAYTIERLMEEGSLDDHPTADTITRFYALAAEERDSACGGRVPVRRLWAVWRGALARGARALAGAGTSVGAGGSGETPRRARGSNAALTAGLIAEEPSDYERMMDAYEELQDLLRAGIAQDAIREALLDRIRTGLASRADVHQALKEALDNSPAGYFRNRLTELARNI